MKPQRAAGRFWIACLLWVLTPVSCSDDDSLPFAPSDCVETKPKTGFLRIELTIDAQNPSVPLCVFRGDMERNDIVCQEAVTATRASYELDVDQYYAVSAQYVCGMDTILVVRGDRISAKTEEYRDATCWTVEDAKVDARLRQATRLSNRP
jgi:hypothetical protein